MPVLRPGKGPSKLLRNDVFVYLRTKLENGPLNRPTAISENTVLGKIWLNQSKECLSCSECQNNVDPALRRRRYDYLVFGMIVWKIRPLPQLVARNMWLDVWYDLGYAAVKEFQEDYLHEAYTNVFCLEVGVAALTFDRYQVYGVIRKKVLENLCEAHRTNPEDSLYRNLSSFFPKGTKRNRRERLALEARNIC